MCNEMLSQATGRLALNAYLCASWAPANYKLLTYGYKYKSHGMDMRRRACFDWLLVARLFLRRRSEAVSFLVLNCNHHPNNFKTALPLGYYHCFCWCYFHYLHPRNKRTSGNSEWASTKLCPTTYNSTKQRIPFFISITYIWLLHRGDLRFHYCCKINKPKKLQGWDWHRQETNKNYSMLCHPY